MVECSPGYDGGLQQLFILEVHDTGLHRIQANLSSASMPVFHVRGLSSGTTFVIVVYAANAKGRSQATVLRTNTLAGPESQTRRGNLGKKILSIFQIDFKFTYIAAFIAYSLGSPLHICLKLKPIYSHIYFFFQI